MNQQRHPLTAGALETLLLAFDELQRAMQAEFPDGSEAGAPAVLLTAHDPERGGSDFKLAGDPYQVCNSLAAILTVDEPLYRELNRELLRLLAWHQLQRNRQN